MKSLVGQGWSKQATEAAGFGRGQGARGMGGGGGGGRGAGGRETGQGEARRGRAPSSPIASSAQLSQLPNTKTRK